MDRRKVLMWSRLALYAGAVLLAVAVVLALRSTQGDFAYPAGWAFIAATAGVFVVVPAVLALAMAKRS